MVIKTKMVTNEQILNWLIAEFNLTESKITILPLAGDASTRRYYRCYLPDDVIATVDPLAGKQRVESLNSTVTAKRTAERRNSYIIMQQDPNSASPESKSAYKATEFQRFITLAKQLRDWGLQAPEIYKINDQQGLLLLSDLGDQLYLTALQHTKDNKAKVTELYGSAIAGLLVMQQQPGNELTANGHLAAMDNNYIIDKLTVFQDWFIRCHLQIKVGSPVQQTIATILTDLSALFAKVFAEQPQVFVHLDYHSRNLLVLPPQMARAAVADPENVNLTVLSQTTPRVKHGANYAFYPESNAKMTHFSDHSPNSLGILDFQDAMFGPITYDLVSLWQDAYISWPREQVLQWLVDYQQRAQTAGVLPKLDFNTLLYWFDLVGLHRHLKNLGVFARLYYRDNKAQYLANMPTLINYIIQTCCHYPSLAPLQQFFVDWVLAGDTANLGSGLK